MASVGSAVPAAIPVAAAQRPAELRAAVELDLSELGLEQIPVVNLRRPDLGPGLITQDDQVVDLDDQLAAMIALRDEGKIGAIGISNVELDTLRRAAARTARRNRLRAERLQPARPQARTHDRVVRREDYRLGALLPTWLGVPKIADNEVVQRIAAEVGATGAQDGLAWLLAHAPNTLLIAGTASITHLQENMRSGDITLTTEQLAALDAVPSPEMPDDDAILAFFEESR
jgi:pyridoxine 4-dehydrogenase